MDRNGRYALRSSAHRLRSTYMFVLLITLAQNLKEAKARMLHANLLYYMFFRPERSARDVRLGGIP